MSLEEIPITADHEKSKLIFLHHFDDFETNEIRKDLIKQNIEAHCLKYEIFGSLNQQENIGKIMHEQHPLEILNSASDNFIRKITNCDIIIFNANSNNFEKVCIEMRQVMKSFEEMYKVPDKEFGQVSKKCLILISTPMTWAQTAPDVITKEDADEVFNDQLLEEDYRRRKAHKSYCKHKLLERDVIWLQKKCKHFLKTLVICPGISYGGENNVFHYIFKLSFYNKELPIVNTGQQNLPMIYIKDFVRIMRNIFENFPESKIRYIFAVQPTVMTLKKFTYNICKAFNEDCSKVRYLPEIQLLKFEEELFPKSVIDMLSLNLKMGLSYLKDFEFHEITDKFWYNLADEFRFARNIHPLKIIVCGPPLVGKTEHSRMLSKYYQIPCIDTCRIIEIYIEFLEGKINDSTNMLANLDSESNSSERNEEDIELIEQLKTNIKEFSKELFDLKVYIASHKDFEDQEFSILSRCLIALISTKQYNANQGYVLDNFPFTYDQANSIFYNTNFNIKISSQEENSDEEKSLHFSLEPLKPTHVIIFDAPDELLCKHAMALTETDAIIRRCLRHQMLPRLDEYRERNEGSECLENIFFDNDLVPISIELDQGTQIDDTLQTIKNEIGLQLVYPLSSAQQKALDKENETKRLKENEDQNRKKEDLVKSLTLERERKLFEWTKKYEEIRKREEEFNEIKTLPMRQYLDKYVLPTLTQGILKVAELQPEDPVDFLAEYLFKCNPEGQQAPPFCTPEQRLRFENTFYEDISSTSSSFIELNKNRSEFEGNK